MAAPSRQSASNAHTNASQHSSSASWVETAEQVFAALGIPALDPKLWDRTWGWEKLKEEVLAINPGDESIIDEQLLQFFDLVGDKFRCRLPINDPATGQSYCNRDLGRKKRILGHLRAHLNYRPFACGGDCGNPSCTERFCEERYRSQHVNPDKGKCPYCNASLYRQNLGGHLKVCEKNPMRTLA